VLSTFIDEIDDGWRDCESCGEGFTLWYERLVDHKNENNGYVEDRCLCEKCFAVAHNAVYIPTPTKKYN